MGFELQVKNLIEDELPVALETAGMEWHAASIRTVGALACAEAAELLQTAFEEVEDKLDRSQRLLVEEFIFWARAALYSAMNGNEVEFFYSFQKFQVAVHNWWTTLIVH